MQPRERKNLTFLIKNVLFFIDDDVNKAVAEARGQGSLFCAKNLFVYAFSLCFTQYLLTKKNSSNETTNLTQISMSL